MSSLPTVFLTGIGLSMDAVAVSISSGMAARPVRRAQALKMALFFGAFQAAMPVVGYLCGSAFHKYLNAIDHWIAFILLGFIGGKMIREAFEKDEDEPDRGRNFETRQLTILAVATSIDALAVGLTFSLLDIPIAIAVGIIGAVTFALCLPAVWLGDRLGSRIAHRAELLGGLVLIGIGTKILIEHLLGKA